MARRAVLVGINDYQRKPLKGCVNDVQDVRSFLVSRCGFADADIRVLLNADATALNIRDALETWLLADAAPGDKLVFHYSGHGSRLPGRGDEVDDIICPVDFDFRTQARASALADDDFREIFRRLPDGVEIVWISDSCHSGDLAIDERSLRVSDVTARYLSPPPSVQAEIDRRLMVRGRTRSLARSLDHFRGVLLAGCDAQESSYDARFDKRSNGAFTYHLLKQLNAEQGLRKDISTLLDVTAAAVTLTFRNQHPQLRGARSQKQKTFLAQNSPLSPPEGRAVTTTIPSRARSLRTTSAPTSAQRRQRPGKRVALVIGNSSYEAFLPNPVHDAALIARKLSSVGFEIVGGNSGSRSGARSNGVDLDKDRMDDLIDDFCAALGEGSTAVIYYAGHGIQVGEVNFLVPTDARLESGAPGRELVSLNLLVDEVSRRVGRAGHVIVFLDACRDNPFQDDQIKELASDLSRRARSRTDQEKLVRQTTARGGLAPMRARKAAPARQFIAYATAPGDTAVDGTPGEKNSPFAAALARHIDVRGMDLDECFDRVGRDVLAQVELIDKVQDPWKSANLKEPFFFQPMSWWPMLVLALVAVPCGILAAYLVVSVSPLQIVNPLMSWTAWLATLSFAPVLAVGTLVWGSRKVRDVLFAVAGSALAFALALIVLQLVQYTEVTPKQPDAIVPAYDPAFTIYFTNLALGAGALTVIGTVMCWEKDRSVRQKLIDMIFPVVLTLLLLALVDSLFNNRSGVSSAFIFTALVAGMLFAGGTSLACKPQASVFRGFGAATGAMIVGLFLPTLSYLHFALTDLPLWLRTRGFGGLWFALLGAQLGYCYAFYVPEYRLQAFRKPRRKPIAVAGRGADSPAKPPSSEEQRRQLDGALSDREAEEILAEDGDVAARGDEPDAAKAAELAARVSANALKLIVRHETGGREHYERVYKSRPVWPEEKSGVTIVFGYDLGYQKDFDSVGKDWKGALPERHIKLLEPAVGKCATAPGRDGKVAEIKAIVRDLVEAGVTVPWPAAQEVFTRVTIPQFACATAAALPGHEKLSDDCFGALVSLTFNRGPSFGRSHDPEKDAIDRYREMRAIKAAVAEGELERIPGLIRTMKRIWKGGKIEAEMNRRRENEARLFEEGLAATLVAAIETPGAAVRDGAPRGDETSAAAREEDIDYAAEDVEDIEDDDVDASTRGIELPTERTSRSMRVGWAPDDRSPDYAHLDSRLGAGAKFILRAADLEFLAELNAFPVDEAGPQQILFGLRGCGIPDSRGSEMSNEVRLLDQRPDHDTTRCVMGVWNRATGKIAVFEASTVPHSRYVIKVQKGGTMGNMLPTGLYGYIVGPHGPNVSKLRPGCFLLRSSIEKKHEVFVRRTRNNLEYELTDIAMSSKAGDNIHPSFSGPSNFESAGCQVVLGHADTQGNHRGPWAEFRRAAGLRTPSGKQGTPYLYMLLTGAEAMRATRAREHNSTGIPEVRTSLMRLRFGSKGDRVSRLQRFLEVKQTGTFDLETAKKLYALQRGRAQNACDGIFSPHLDEALGAGVFNDAPPPPTPPPPPTGEVPPEGSPAGQPPSSAPAADAAVAVVAPGQPVTTASASAADAVASGAAAGDSVDAGADAEPDDLPTLDDEDVLRGEPPEPDDGSEPIPRGEELRAPTSIVNLAIEAKGREYYATDEDGKRCYVGKSKSFARQNTLGIGLNSSMLRYDRFEEEKRSGAWAHFIWPTVMAESNGLHLVINCYDRAHFTWGFYQLAAHTPNENLIVLFRELLKLPLARYYFPDLTLHDGRVAQMTADGPKSLERVGWDKRKGKERQILDFMAYLNPSSTEIDQAEIINSAKLVHWALRDPAMLETTMRVSIETMKKKLVRLDKIFGLTGRTPEVALWVSDIFHQGRGSKPRVLAALDLPSLEQQLEALSQFDSGGRDAARCRTVRRHVAMLREERRFEGMKFGMGLLSLAPSAPPQQAPQTAPQAVAEALSALAGQAAAAGGAAPWGSAPSQS